MTIILFLVDTSASMSQRAYLGGRPSILDVAKSAVETFVKVRQRNPESRGDRYMLLTFEEHPYNIKAGWKENLSTFMNELKNLQCIGLTTMGSALKHAFDLLNLNRMQSGIDTYGQGRCPFYLEPSIILVITDGGRLSSTTSVTEDFNLPMNAPIPGSELTREPFRWDQRLFALVLRLSGTPANERDIGLVPSDDSPIDAMCEVTGGRSYCITSHRMMMQCIDSLVQKVQSGVVIFFEKIGPDPESIKDTENPSELIFDIETSTDQNGTNNQNNNSWHSCRKMIYVTRSAQKGFAVGFWPLPESFWPDTQMTVLPPRLAHPNVKFSCINQDPMVIDNLPFDKYELEPSPLTQYILARKQPSFCWQVFVPNSSKNSDVGHPFGYLKASTLLTCVNLFVMPYNYPVLLPLLDELFKVHRLKPTNEWNNQFRNYLRTMPPYYAAPLRRALQRMGASTQLSQTLIPDNFDTSISYVILNYLKKIKNQAKIEYDRVCNDVLNRQNLQLKNSNNQQNQPSRVRVVTKSVKKNLITHPDLLGSFASSFRDQMNEYGGYTVSLPMNNKPPINVKSFRNPFDINRSNLLDQVVRMRANFLQPCTRKRLVDDDVTHSLPVNQMGNYQEYLKRMPTPLREIESTPVRQHMFGNPFKIDKRMMVDEADNIDLISGASPPLGGSSGALGSSKSLKRSMSPFNDKLTMPNMSKRRPGPIPRDLFVRRPSISRSPSLVTTPLTPDVDASKQFNFDDFSTTNFNEPTPSPTLMNETKINYSNQLGRKNSCEELEEFNNLATKPLENDANEPKTDLESIDLNNTISEPIVKENCETVKPINYETVNGTNTYQDDSDENRISSIIESLPTNSSSWLLTFPVNHQVVTTTTVVTTTIQSTIFNSTFTLAKPEVKWANRFLPRNGSNSNKPIENGLMTMSAKKSNLVESLKDVKENNVKIKKLLISHVRRPGRVTPLVLEHAKKLKEPGRELILRDVHREALRFKRDKMAESILSYMHKCASAKS